MHQQAVPDILPDHVDGLRDFKIFGHFLEHFHRQLYGGVHDPGSPLADNVALRDWPGWSPQHTTLQPIIASAWNWQRQHPQGYRESAP